MATIAAAHHKRETTHEAKPGGCASASAFESFSVPEKKAVAVAAATAGDLTVMLNSSLMSTQKMPAQEMLHVIHNVV